MSMQKLHRKSAELDSLGLYAALGAHSDDSRNIDDPERITEFITKIQEGVATAVSRPSTLYGWHAQNFFGALVAALDGVDLLKEEDSGATYYAGDKIKVPDWSIVLKDGRRILVEVKSVGPKQALGRGLRISAGEVQGLRNYAAKVGGDSYIASYWAGTNLWTLVPLSDLVLQPGESKIDLRLTEAIQASEMSLLGDRWIGIRPSLKLEIFPAAESDAALHDEGVEFTIGGLRFWCGEHQMETKQERDIVMFLLMHSGWESHEEAIPSADGSRLDRIEWSARPTEHDATQDFAMVGTLSSLYSSLYMSMTASSDGVTSLAREPEIGVLPRLIPEDFSSPRLPLWQFVVEPGI